MAWFAIVGPRDAGASERDRMFSRAGAIFNIEGVDEPVRVDVPAKGAAAAEEGTALRDAVRSIVPALQSGSLFGGKTGVVVVDTQQLLKAEVDAIADMLANADEDQAVAVFIASGTLPAGIKKLVAGSGRVETIKAVTERDAGQWITAYAKTHGLRVDAEARTALIQTFGSNTSQMQKALEQIAVNASTVTADEIEARFTNRPDEPMWFLGDAIMAGDQAQALRRLSDFLEHQHPLVFLSYLEGEVRKRSLAAVAPDYDTFTEWAKANPNSYATKKIWDARTRANAGALSDAVGAISRADLTLKTMPVATHRVTLERLTVAMCRWMAR